MGGLPGWVGRGAAGSIGRGVLAVLLLGGVGCTSDPAAEVPGADVPVEEVAARFGDAVWRVETDGCGWAGVGSAFAVDEHRLVTNHHVIAHDTTPLLRSRQGELREGRVIGADAELDVAVIEVAGAPPLPVELGWVPTEAATGGAPRGAGLPPADPRLHGVLRIGGRLRRHRDPARPGALERPDRPRQQRRARAAG